MMSGYEVSDLSHQGPNFTWHIHIQGVRYLAKWLDIMLTSLDWQTSFPKAYVDPLYKLHSDHNLIILRCGIPPRLTCERPFRFEAAWTTHSDYQDIVCSD
jgi:hypothetical protein